MAGRIREEEVPAHLTKPTPPCFQCAGPTATTLICGHIIVASGGVGFGRHTGNRLHVLQVACLHCGRLQAEKYRPRPVELRAVPASPQAETDPNCTADREFRAGDHPLETDNTERTGSTEAQQVGVRHGQ